MLDPLASSCLRQKTLGHFRLETCMGKCSGCTVQNQVFPITSKEVNTVSKQELRGYKVSLWWLL